MKLFSVIAMVLLITSCKSSIQNNELYYLSTSGRSYSKEELIKLKDPNLTIDSIVERHIRAVGGLDAIHATRVLHEKMIHIKYGDTTITDSWFELGKKGRTFVKKKDAFFQFFATEKSGFAIIEEDSLPSQTTIGEYVTNEQRYFINLFGPNYYGMPGLLIGYRSKGIQVKRVDKMTEGMYELAVYMPDQRILHLLFDPTTFMVIRSTVEWENAPEKIPYMMDYRDFTVTKEGYRYPRSQYWVNVPQAPEATSDSSIRGWNIITEYNPHIPDTIFKVNRAALSKYQKDSEDYQFSVDAYENSHKRPNTNF